MVLLRTFFSPQKKHLLRLDKEVARTSVFCFIQRPPMVLLKMIFFSRKNLNIGGLSLGFLGVHPKIIVYWVMAPILLINLSKFLLLVGTYPTYKAK